MLNVKKRFAAVLLVFAMSMALPLSGCVPDKIGQFTDDAGTAITLEAPPENIICLVPAITELMFALGEGERLSAVSTYCDYPADGIKDLRRFEFGAALSVEALLAHGGDALFMTKMNHDRDKADLLRAAGMNVIVFEAQRISDIERHITILGDIFGKESAAKKIISDMDEGFNKVKAALKDKSEVSAFLEISPVEATLYSVNNSTFLGEVLEMCRVDNIFKDEQMAWVPVSEESVIIRNPSVILKMYKDEDYTSFIGGELVPIAARAGWSAINAVKHGRVVQVDEILYSRATNRLPQVACDLALIMHGVTVNL